MLALSYTGVAQNNLKIVDSLKTELSKTSREEHRAKIYGDLTWYYSQISTDSALVYGKKAMVLAQKLNDSAFLAQTISDNAVVYYLKGDYKVAKALFKKSLKVRTSLSDSAGIASLNFKIGNIFYKTTSLDSAMVYYVRALEYYESHHIDVIANSLKSNIASIYMSLKNYDKALDYLKSNINYFEKNKEHELLGNALVNLATVYLYKQDTIEAIKTLKRGILTSEKINAYPTLGSAYNNLGTIYSDKGDYKLAKTYILKSIEIRKKTNLSTELASSELTLAGIYNALGEFDKAKPLLLENLEVFKNEGITDKLLSSYLQLIPAYAYQAKPDSVAYYTDLYVKSRDISLQEKMQNITSEIETKYQTEKKEKQILLQRADLAEKELNLTKKNTQLIGLGVLVFMLALLGYLLYNQQKLKNRQLQKENELKAALVKIETQNRLQEQRFRISRDLHDNIGAQLTFIISSIENLKFGYKIENSELNDKLKYISAFAKDTIYDLRDTIWAMNKSEISLEDLQARITNFIDKAKESTSNVKFEFNVDETIPDNVTFSSIKGMNMYRIIQEAVNNTIKYAEASQLEIQINQIINGIEITIKDNGKGFDINSVEHGNGLSNMRKRAQDIHADYHIESVPNQGTAVILKLEVEET
ncbi:tetratricopeptide repeat-containing sensor histidine kinase [Changchengzhania lutea]|uniref:tetratricopeptide repeat-containing sensor histidine kinase n=1 Tax=Changchengzhania lutea TaxID=2049305 RepID=UPI001FEA9D5B|nr:tetratricopeptide repeat protein [Changchengzhania lutea]